MGTQQIAWGNGIQMRSDVDDQVNDIIDYFDQRDSTDLYDYLWKLPMTDIGTTKNPRLHAAKWVAYGSVLAARNTMIPKFAADRIQEAIEWFYDEDADNYNQPWERRRALRRFSARVDHLMER